MKIQAITVDINPHLKQIWIGRVPKPCRRGYAGGRSYRNYRHTAARACRMFDACTRAGLEWSQDNNGTHFTRKPL